MEITLKNGKRTEVPNQLSIEQVSQMTDRSTQIVRKWMRGTPTKAALPHKEVMEGNRRRLYIPTSKLVAWAKKHEVEISSGA